MERYERLEKIGEGVSGVVYKARDTRTGDTVAIKRLRGNGADDDSEVSFLREARCLEAFRGHPRLVGLRDAHRDSAGVSFLVMDYVDGPSVADVMRDRRGRPFPEAETRRLVRQLLDGAMAMHELGVMHRDLKPDNILVDSHGDLKICDFGMSRLATPPSAPLTAPVVTLWYRSPELLLGSQYYDAGVDTWALGCIMAELLTGAPLFAGRSEMDQLNKVFDAVGMQDMKDWHGFARLPRGQSPLCNRLRPHCSRLPEMLAGLSADGIDVLTGLLALRPDKRLTAADALRSPWFDDADNIESNLDQHRNACGGAVVFTACVADAIVV